MDNPPAGTHEQDTPARRVGQQRLGARVAGRRHAGAFRLRLSAAPYGVLRLFVKGLLNSDTRHASEV